MAVTWTELRRVLRDLRSREPSPLQGFPDPRSAAEEPPYELWLHAWAVDDAAELHQRFGSDITLTVGAFPYPPDPVARAANPRRSEHRIPAEDVGITVALEQPLVIRSGSSARPNALVSNHSDRDVSIRTNRQLQSSIIGPNGAEVGGYVGAQRMPGMTFVVTAGGSETIPVLVGTGGVTPEIGYAVPPGRWSLQVELDLQDGRRLRSAPLPIEIIQ